MVFFWVGESYLVIHILCVQSYLRHALPQAAWPPDSSAADGAAGPEVVLPGGGNDAHVEVALRRAVQGDGVHAEGAAVGLGKFKFEY